MEKDGLTISFTVGEVAIATLSNSSTLITQGFHQADYYKVTSMSEQPAFQVNIYPNPTYSDLYISGFDHSLDLRDTELKIFDISGQRLQDFSSEQLNEEIRLNLRAFSSGVYLLQLRNLKNNKTSIYKILKF